MECPVCFEDDKKLFKICQCKNGSFCSTCCKEMKEKSKCPFCRQACDFGLKDGKVVAFVGPYYSGKTRHAIKYVEDLNIFCIVVSNYPSEWYDIGSYFITEEDFLSMDIKDLTKIVQKGPFAIVFDNRSKKMSENSRYYNLLMLVRHYKATVLICTTHLCPNELYFSDSLGLCKLRDRKQFKRLTTHTLNEYNDFILFNRNLQGRFTRSTITDAVRS